MTTTTTTTSTALAGQLGRKEGRTAARAGSSSRSRVGWAAETQPQPSCWLRSANAPIILLQRSSLCPAPSAAPCRHRHRLLWPLRHHAASSLLLCSLLDLVSTLPPKTFDVCQYKNNYRKCGLDIVGSTEDNVISANEQLHRLAQAIARFTTCCLAPPSLSLSLLCRNLSAQIEKLAATRRHRLSKYEHGMRSCNWQTTDVTSVKFSCPVATAIRGQGMLNLLEDTAACQAVWKIMKHLKLQRTFLWVQAGHRLVYQRPRPLTRRLARAAPLASHTQPLLLPLTLNDIQVSTLTADWCILQLFLTLASGWDWKIVSCIDDARRQQKILLQNVRKNSTHTNEYIYRCVRV